MQATGGKNLTRLVGWMIGMLGLAAVALVGANVLKVARDIDATALQREAGAIDHGFRLLGEFAAGDLLGFSQWDDALREIVWNSSTSWMTENLGPDVFQEPAEDRILVIDEHGEAIFASDGDRTDEAANRDAVRAAADVLARSGAIYRKAVAEDLYLDDRYGDGLYYGIYAHDIARIAGVASLIVAAPLVGEDDEVEVPETPAFLLEILALTPDMLERLGSMAHLTDVVLLDDGEETTGPVHVIRDMQGGEVARLTWNHVPPGTAMLRSAVPALALSVLVLGALVWLVSRVLRRNTIALAASEQSALHASRHDPATGLANRGWFLSEFERIAAREADGQSYVTLIDCDHFKAINDTHGHAAGDAVLVAIAERLRAFGPKLQIAARLGGDEFAAVTAPLSSHDECEWLLNSIIDALTRPVFFRGRSIPVHVSMGAAIVGQGESTQTMLVRADMALYRAKRDGRGCLRVHDPRVDAEGALPQMLASGRRSGSREAA